MNPTFSDGDIVFVQKWSQDLSPGDVIVFRAPGQENAFIKRLVGAANSEIFIDNFKVYVNTKPFSESTSFPPQWRQDAFECRFSDVFKTGHDEFFVLGDNRCSSADSRFFGPVKKEAVIGKVSYSVHNIFRRTLGPHEN